MNYTIAHAQKESLIAFTNQKDTLFPIYYLIFL